MNPLVMHVQKCSIHDGPGIRTTVFFKGCPLACAWCHNPESQAYAREVLYNEEKCSRCLACIKVCDRNAIYEVQGTIGLDKDKCIRCGKCIDSCINNARQMVGREYCLEELVREIEKDRMFYDESCGGVTFSGGEVMTQNMDFVCQLARKCKNKGIHVAMDTCGYAPYTHFQQIMNDTDLFLYDLKMMDRKNHIKYTGRSNEIILENLQRLVRDHANIHLRIPLIQGVNIDSDNREMARIVEFVKPLGIETVHLLPYHGIGKHKYTKLYLVYPGESFEKPSDDKLEQIRQLFSDNGFDVSIGG